jgi:surface polysaccharide O-acyltransferase-like enzyme
MTMIIAFHFIWYNKWPFYSELFTNKLLSDILYYFGELGVNVFFLISGYFLPNTTFKWKKLILMILQIYCYFYACRIAIILFTKAPIDTYNLSSWFFPVFQSQWWFASAYLLVYILTPFLQKLILTINKKEFKILIFSQLIIWSVFPTIFLTAIGKPTNSMMFYNRYVFIILLYFIGAYIKIYGIPVFSTTQKSISIFIGTAAILFSYIFLVEFFFQDTDLAIQFWDCNSLFQVILSISLFCYFKNLVIGCHTKINRIAACVFGIYLLHEGPFGWNIWHKVFVFSKHKNDPLLFVRIFFAVAVLMLAGIIVEFCRQPFEKYISKVLDRIIFRIKQKLPIDRNSL